MGAKVAFNHAMLYVADLERSVRFYEAIGTQVVEAEPGHFARLAFPDGGGRLTLHQASDDDPYGPGGVRLYFEVDELEALCTRLDREGINLTRPSLMGWGWRHSYLRDPDGYELSLYRPEGDWQRPPARA